MFEDVTVNSTIPMEADWGDYQTEIDCTEAYQLFSGKDTDSLTSLFAESIGRCVDALHFMPPKVFHYYAVAFCDYIKTAETLVGLEESDRARAAAGLFTLLENKLHISPDDLEPIYSELMTTAEHVAKNQANYFADKAKYGDFSSRLFIFNSLAKESRII